MYGLKLFSLIIAFSIGLKRNIAMFLIAFMLGMSNVILEETRMVHDTKVQIELQEVIPDDIENTTLNSYDNTIKKA